MKNILVLLVICITSTNYSQNQHLLNESWFVHSARDISTNSFFDDIGNTSPELRFELTFLSNKIVLEGCCGGVFEMDVNYVGNDTFQILNLTEIQTIGCNENYVSNFYNTIKGAFNSMISDTITYEINSHSQFLYLNINYQNNSSFVTLTNIPLEDPSSTSTSPYWGHEPPVHQWSLTHVDYQGQTMELPYGAALTIADVYEGTFAIALCGEIFVAINSSYYLDVEDYLGPCFISCGILENTIGVCDPVAGYDLNYLETFKQNAYDFLNYNINQTMEYTFTFGSARKLIIEDYSQNKLIFHSNANYLSTRENKLLPAFTIYPNPVHESLNIYTSHCSFCTVKIYITNGTLLYSENQTSPQVKIDVKQLSTGIYFVVVENDLGVTQTRKFVKK